MVRRRCLSRVAVCLMAAALLLPASISAQTFYGSIVGSVTDPSGSVVPGASVTLTNNATAERRNATSGADGAYRFVNLVPGTYKVEVASSGFSRYTRDQIQVNVDTVVRVDVAMQLGNVEQTVEVVGDVPVLQTETAAIGSVVSTRPVQELPLNGRNVLNLVSLAPGVVPQGSSEGSLTGKNVFAGGNYQIGGGTANQSATYYDGVPTNDGYGNIVALIPSPEAVSEFRVQTNSNSAEFGRFTGGVVNIASRSGTNNFHGSLYEYHRNKVLNANTFFGNRSGLERPPFVQNQYGGALGGPVLKDKLFFFFNYEGYRNREGALFTRTVPTVAMRNGDFSDFRDSSGRVIPIFDPWTECGIVNPGTGVMNAPCVNGQARRQQFPGNIIPQDRISPVARKFLDFPIYADPTTPGPWKQQNFNSNASTGGDNDQITARGDYNVSENNRLLVRYTRWKSANLPVDVYGNGSTNGDPYSPERFVTIQSAVADTYTINPTTVLDVRLGFMRWFYDRTPGHVGIDIPATFGLPQNPYGEISQRNQVPNSTRDPSISATNYNTIGTGLIYAVDNTYVLSPTLTKIVGSHTLKFGGEIRRADINYYQNNAPGGTFTFNNAPTAADGANAGSRTLLYNGSPISAGSGDSLASFLLGYPTGGVLQISPFTAGGARYQGYFINDSWQVNQRLTLNLGVRWEIPGVYTERFDRQISFNPDIVNPSLASRGMLNPVTGQPYMGAFVLVNSPLQPERGLRPEKYNLFAPRVGIAYRLTDTTVVRLGGGMYYVPSTVNFPEGPTQAGISYLVNTISTSSDNNRTFISKDPFQNPFPTGINNPTGRDPSFQDSLLGGTARPHLRNEDFPGYTQQWNLAIQHEFANGFSVEAAYVGLQGKHLQTGLQMNVLDMDYITKAAADPTGFGGTGACASPACAAIGGGGLRQQVANPFAGLIPSGPLSNATIQRGLLLRPFPEYDSLNRSSYVGGNQYHSLQVRADKRFGGGGVLSANYTFSKNTSNVETLTTWLEAGQGTGGFQTPNDLSREWALSSFDARHRAVISYVVDLPFGQGRMFLNNASGITEKLVSGWSINGATTFQFGYPLTITATGSGAGWPQFGYGLRANYNPSAAGCNGQRKIDAPAQERLDEWFNTSCFSVPTPWTFGNESRTDAVLRGHGINNWNMALSKKTNITEQVALTFKAEAFNLFNRVQFNKPNMQANTNANNQFGVVTTAANQPRLFQLALRLTF